MPLLSPTAGSQMLNGLDGGATNVLAYTSCHTGSPGSTGANEYSGVTRQASTWTSSTGGAAKTNNAGMTWSTSGSSAVTYFGTFSAATAGTFGIGLALGASVQAATITAAVGALSISQA